MFQTGASIEFDVPRDQFYAVFSVDDSKTVTFNEKGTEVLAVIFMQKQGGTRTTEMNSQALSSHTKFVSRLVAFTAN